MEEDETSDVGCVYGRYKACLTILHEEDASGDVDIEIVVTSQIHTAQIHRSR